MSGTRTKILTDICNSGLVNKIANRYSSYIQEFNLDDFVQTIYLFLCDLPEEKLVELYNNKELDYYIIAIVRNQAINTKSKFNLVYNNQVIEYNSEKVISCKDESE